MSELEIKMAGVLTQLLVIEGVEGDATFYVELGQDLKKMLLKTLSKKQVMIAQMMAKQQIKDITE